MTMIAFPVTLAAGGILGLIYVALSLNVSMARVKSKVSLGDGAGEAVKVGKEAAAPKLQIACRIHANFAEYVPMALLLLGGIEAAGAARWLVELLAVLLVLARIAHPAGMVLPTPNLFRAGGALLTWVVIGWAAIEALFIAL
jgi:uncharacterized membrane protein YecN with MAPEG domain